MRRRSRFMTSCLAMSIFRNSRNAAIRMARDHTDTAASLWLCSSLYSWSWMYECDGYNALMLSKLRIVQCQNKESLILTPSPPFKSLEILQSTHRYPHYHPSNAIPQSSSFKTDSPHVVLHTSSPTSNVVLHTSSSTSHVVLHFTRRPSHVIPLAPQFSSMTTVLECRIVNRHKSILPTPDFLPMDPVPRRRIVSSDHSILKVIQSLRTAFFADV